MNYDKYLKYKKKYLTEKNNMIQQGGNINTDKEYIIHVNDKIKDFIHNKDVLPLYDIKDLPSSLKYSYEYNFKNFVNCHLGQRKLLLTEIEFYNKCVDFNKSYTDNNIVIYGGSASCEHLPIILEMYPKLKFILIDPNYHSIDGKYKYIYQNVDVIDNENNKAFLNNLKQNNNRSKHLHKTTKMLLESCFMYDNKTHDVLNLNQNNHKKTMNQFKSIFYEKKENVIENIIKDDTRVYIIQDYLTINVCNLLKSYIDNTMTKPNIFFLTDIRTMVFKGISDVDIVWNSALQIIFLKILRPEFSMLKFRVPFYLEKSKGFMKELIEDTSGRYDFVKNDLEFVKKEYKLDLITNYNNNKFIYFQNDFIFIQPWAPPLSSETRFFVSKKNIDAPYTEYTQDYEHQFYYFNFLRNYKFFSIFYDITKKHKELHYDGCMDCCREIMILDDYIVTKQSGINSHTYDMKQIRKTLDNNDNIKQLIYLYKLINSFTFFDLSQNNYKCKHGNNTYYNEKIVYEINNTKLTL